MNDFIPVIDVESSVPKFMQLVNAFENAVNSNILKEGDSLPSVNELCKQCDLSRDTVFKGYTELKRRRLIESVPNKGYYVTSDNQRVFLFLDTFKAYKEVLYGAFRDALPNSYNVDIHFHHYNVSVFENIIKNAIGKYSHYIIMNFDHEVVKRTVSDIDPLKLLCIDWIVNVPKGSSFVGQNFGQPVYDNLYKIKTDLLKYKKFIFVYPEFTNHPPESISFFEQFCIDQCLNYQIVLKTSELNPQKGDLYLTVSDRILARLLDFIQGSDLSLGKDIGIISYNETPTKKYIKEGITVISTDFNEIGNKMAQFILKNKKINELVPTNIIKRLSL